MRAAILLLAAGASRRMRGRDKLMEKIDGTPLLRRQALAALATGLPVTVTLPGAAPGSQIAEGSAPLAQARLAALDGLDVQIVWVPDACEGMSASIRAGVGALPGLDAVMILPADMPDIDTDAIQTLYRRYTDVPNQVVRAASDAGKSGHPVIFPSRLFPALLTISGDQGARAILRSEPVELVPLPGAAATCDLDTPEAWAAWRAQHRPGTPDGSEPSEGT